MVVQYFPELTCVLGFKDWQPGKHYSSQKNAVLYDSYEECKKECDELNKQL